MNPSSGPEGTPYKRAIAGELSGSGKYLAYPKKKPREAVRDEMMGGLRPDRNTVIRASHAVFLSRRFSSRENQGANNFSET